MQGIVFPLQGTRLRFIFHLITLRLMSLRLRQGEHLQGSVYTFRFTTLRVRSKTKNVLIFVKTFGHGKAQQGV